MMFIYLSMIGGRILNATLHSVLENRVVGTAKTFFRRVITPRVVHKKRVSKRAGSFFAHTRLDRVTQGYISGKKTAMKPSLTITLFISAFALSACSSIFGPGPEEDRPADAVDMRIAEAVDTSSKANKAISEVEVATAAPVRSAPAQTIPDNVVLPPKSVQPITVDWNGPIETFLEAISARSGYDLVVTGRAPANQVMVTISADDEPLYGVVRRAGNMVHGYADIGFNPANETIELRYGG